MRLAELIPHAGNARKHTPAQLAQLVASIEHFGWTVPVLIDIERRIIAGHGRVLAASLMGLETVPCVTLSQHWTDAQRRAYVIADNKLALNAGWDFALLAHELQALDVDQYAITLTGFDASELEQIATWTPADAMSASRPGGAGAHTLHQVVIDCADEAQQRDVLSQLHDLSIVARAVTR